MPPKKREKESEPSKLERMDQEMLMQQQKHEQFLQAFEKPTQIYRYLRTRHNFMPLFMNRTLSYMRHRMSRHHSSRQGFKVDNMLEQMVKKNKAPLEPRKGYMTLTYLGFIHEGAGASELSDPVKVETLLAKISYKKRKDAASPMVQVSMGTCDVPFNPCRDRPPSKAAAVSIPGDSFNVGGHVVKSYVLLVRASCVTQAGVLGAAQQNQSEPPSKRRKSSKQYSSELVVYDKHNRCLLNDGDYDVVVREYQPHAKNSPKKHASWETIGEIKQDCVELDSYSAEPKIRFRLAWTMDPVNSLVDWPQPHQQSDQNKENIPMYADIGSSHESHSEQRLQIIYQFLYNNNSRQQTEACEDLTCPWCSLDCHVLYSLLKHLKLCHPRFMFTYVPIKTGSRIDVAINDLYDGSYSGSALDMAAQPPGMAFSRMGPVRRTVASNVLVCRPKRVKPSLSEFLEQDPDPEPGRPGYITGHNRLYHHTVTMMPVYPKEMDSDSEGEHDPLWLQTKTMMMIDEFTDVNEGEKELMKMWNLHVMKHGYVGDCQIPLACMMFLDNRGRDLLAKNLYRNFVLHMCSLFDFGLISPVTLYETVQRLQEMMEQTASAGEIFQSSVAAHHANKSTAKREKPLTEMSFYNKNFELTAKVEQDHASSSGNRSSLLHAKIPWEDSPFNNRKQSGSTSTVPSSASFDFSDDLQPNQTIQVVHSSPQISLKSCLKSRTSLSCAGEDTCGDVLHAHTATRDKRVKWVAEADVFYCEGDAVVGHGKEALCEERDQHVRNAAYSSGYTRMGGVPTIARHPFLETVWPDQ